MKQQSAVEWLEKEYNLKGKLTPVDFYQAKELFKQQIIEAHCDGQSIEDTLGVSDVKQYFNDKFKTETK